MHPMPGLPAPMSQTRRPIRPQDHRPRAVRQSQREINGASRRKVPTAAAIARLDLFCRGSGRDRTLPGACPEHSEGAGRAVGGVIDIEVKTAADGGTSKVYLADDPANYSDTDYAGYEMRGLEARSSSYVKEMILGEYGEIFPSAVGGGSTTYWCDNHYSDVSTSSLRAGAVGGHAHSGSAAGIAFSHSSYTPSAAYVNFGTRLCFIPATAGDERLTTNN